MNLAALLEPVAIEEFLHEEYGTQMRLIPGRAGKFDQVFSWANLNRMLRLRHREWITSSENPPISLALDGKQIPSTQYSQELTRADGSRVRRVDPSRANHLLRRGATLLVRDADGFDDSLAELGAAFQRDLHEPVSIAALASWGTSKGFGLHLDLQDGFILQVKGCKHWAVYGQTRPYPFADDELSRPPEGEPIWAGELSEGDLLYVPRGWWHDVVSVGEPSLHLTINVYKRTGVDVLAWLVRELRGNEMVRMDVPRFGGRDERAGYVAGLKEALRASLDDDVVDRFLEAWDVGAVPRRPRFSLPWSATRAVLPEGDPLLRLVAPRALTPRVLADGRVEFVVAKKTWELDTEEYRALQPLLEKGQCRLSELLPSSVERHGPIRETVVDLILGGLISIAVDVP